LLVCLFVVSACQRGSQSYKSKVQSPSVFFFGLVRCFFLCFDVAVVVVVVVVVGGMCKILICGGGGVDCFHAECSSAP